MSASLKDWKSKKVCVLTCDGRIFVGILLGHDQVQNLILNDAQERLYSADADVEEEPLGLYVVRGDNVCVVGDYDETKLASIQRAPNPIPNIHHGQPQF